MNNIEQFEKEFAAFAQAKHGFAFWKARVAEYAIMKAMGVGPGDEVIMPGYTCVMDVNPVMYLGAKPVYIDIEPVTYNIDASKIEEAITPNTKIIVAQHTYSYPCEMDEIMAIANKHNIPVLEDCCLAIGSTYKGKACGTFGVASYWSFQWNKPFTTGVGGMATTNDPELAKKIEHIMKTEMVKPKLKPCIMLALQRMVYRTVIYPRTTALVASVFRWLVKKRIISGSSSAGEYTPVMEDGYFCGMGSAQAKAGVAQLKKVKSNIAHRKNACKQYEALLRESGWDIPKIPDYLDTACVRFPLRVTNKQKAVDLAPGSGVEIGTWFECPLHPIETPMHLYGYKNGMCPEAEKACREVINLPTHPRASASTLQRTVSFVNRLKENNDTSN